MSVQYQTGVDWDVTLIDLEYTDATTAPTAMQGLVQTAVKTTSGAPTATAGKFIPGAIVQNAVTGLLYVNTGSTASPVWTVIDTASGLALTNAHIFVGNASNLPADVAMSGDVTISNAGVTTVGANKITGAKLVTGVGYFTVAAATNGTTPVNVIAATVPFNATITGVYLVSEDTTAGNITVADTAGTVATIAKGTVSGVMVGAASLANTAITSGNTLTIVSSSAGNARVFITFTTA